MVYCFFAVSTHINLLCIFYNFFFLSASLENDTSTIPSVDYETFFENDSFTKLDQNQSQWYNISVTNTTVENITEINTSVNEGIDSIPYWQLYDSFLSFSTPDENICICDLYYNACDINCCCDLDCDENDMKVFSTCHFQVSYVDDNYCYLTDIILRNNTVYQIQKSPNNGLLCIVHNNLKQYLRFKDLPHLKSQRDLDVLLKYHSTMFYSWDTEVQESKSKEPDIKSGNSISISVSQKETIWSLPHSCFAGTCTCKRQVLYLEDYSTSCTLTINDFENECKNNEALSGKSYTNFCLSTQKGLSNNLFAHSKAINSNKELYSEVDKFCLTENFKNPTFLKESNTCYNVVNHINFTVFHSGILGIQEIKANFNFVNISADSSFVTQHFSVEFKWYNSTESAKRSGNPGYQVGLPIVTGTNSSQSEEEPFKVKIQPQGLSVFGKDSLSQCRGEERKSIKFGRNFKTSCYFKMDNKDCKALQEQTYDILLGPGRDNLFIGMFGNANDSNRDEWIEAYHEEYDFPNMDSVCHLTTGLKINVVYAAVGTVQNPQFKILGLGYRYMNFKDVDISNSKQHNVMLSLSVSFFDVTEPVIPHYLKAPSLKVNLPADFFYPFLHGS